MLPSPPVSPVPPVIGPTWPPLGSPVLINGTAGDDLIYGDLFGYENDAIYGFAGNDTIHGGLGDDSIDGGVGNDNLYGDAGSDTIHGGAGSDTINGGTLHSADGSNRLFGDAGDDYIDGGFGPGDQISGGDGNDLLIGSSGTDVIHGDAGNDAVNAADGNDTIYGDAGADNLSGEAGNDTINGGDGSDWLQGGFGDDTMHGGKGDDFLDEMEGQDSRYGDDGNDAICVTSVKDALQDAVIDGGTGFDTLEIAGTGATIAGIGLLAATVHNIEAIGLAFSDHTRLMVNPQDVIDFSPSHSLVVTGGIDAEWWVDPTTNDVTSVHTGPAWHDAGFTTIPTSSPIVGVTGATFHEYTATVAGITATLLVDTALPQHLT